MKMLESEGSQFVAILKYKFNFLMQISTSIIPLHTKKNQLHELKVYENNSPGQFIKTLKASDADSGVNSLLTFALDDESNAMFELENRTGKLRVQGRLDREEKEMHTFQVVVKDNGEPVRTDMASVVVRVMDENDEKPTFPLAVQSFTVQENEPPGKSRKSSS